MSESFVNAASNQLLIFEIFFKSFFKSIPCISTSPVLTFSTDLGCRYFRSAGTTAKTVGTRHALRRLLGHNWLVYLLTREAAGLDDYLLFGALLADCLMSDLYPICTIHLVWLVDWWAFVLICQPDDCTEGVNAVLMVWLISWLCHW